MPPTNTHERPQQVITHNPNVGLYRDLSGVADMAAFAAACMISAPILVVGHAFNGVQKALAWREARAEVPHEPYPWLETAKSIGLAAAHGAGHILSYSKPQDSKPKASNPLSAFGIE